MLLLLLSRILCHHKLDIRRHSSGCRAAEVMPLTSLCELFTLQRYDFFIKNTGVVISVS